MRRRTWWHWLGGLIMAGTLMARGESPVSSLYDFTMKDIDGREVKLSDYRGKVLLIVNVASQCGFTKQYAGLEALYQRYRERGLVVLGFPSNDFMGQEPGTEAEIKQFCTLNFGVTFPLFAKISVKGKSIHPLFAYLTDKSIHPEHGGAISWNFNKFIIDREGRVVARFGSRTAPEAPEMAAVLDRLLPGE